jgi:hypothetical protein
LGIEDFQGGRFAKGHICVVTKNKVGEFWTIQDFKNDFWRKNNAGFPHIKIFESLAKVVKNKRQKFWMMDFSSILMALL